ncbi:MAG TPA: phospholipase D-like domain-containing protein, partial [Thermoanaerobaculia bacterium]
RNLERRDPKLYAELSAKLEKRRQRISNESTAAPVDITLETIVREGRPALLVQDHRITGLDTAIDEASEEIMKRLREAAPVIEPLIPLVGRIDVANHRRGFPYVGTGWMIDKNVVATNRHVAQLITREEKGTFVFQPGRLGEKLQVAVDFRREHGSGVTESAPVTRVIWMQTDEDKADFALLEIGRRTDGRDQDHIKLADADADPDAPVVVVGYPARAPADIIPDQAWMDSIYGGTYDVKRVAPGMMGNASRGWSTHDATTLGGNSGSVVLDMNTGRAVALHFAGLYMIENYCVPASTLRQYLKHRETAVVVDTRKPEESRAVQQSVTVDAGEVSITIPLTIKVSLGQAVVDDGNAVTPPRAQSQSKPTPATIGSRAVLDAARSLARELQGGGVLAVRHGYLIRNNQLSDTACVVVAADPSRIEEVRARAPKDFAGFPVDVRNASLRDQAGETVDVAEEAPRKIAYNDEDRTGKGFSFDWVDEEIDARIHVGPERSWTELLEFLTGTESELVSSIYEFHAAHIADALERELREDTTLTLVMAPQSRDGSHHADGDFVRAERFEKWERKFGQEKFERIFVPTGNGGLVATSYHIKVTVRDRDSFWLSSGNWKRASQPMIAKADLNRPSVAGKAGNREWHVVMRNETLADRFRNHILADYQQCIELEGTNEAVEDQVLVDVPMAALEAIAREAAPKQVFEPLPVKRRVRVKPLLTPDRKGAVYSDAVLKLIKSAKKQLLFQNQYISVDEHSTGFFSDLVDALVERSQEIEDVRIILRSGGDGFWDNMAELKRRGMDVNRCVRRISATHTKGIIIDGNKVLVGSHNWSSLGVTLNRDASLIFDDAEIAQYFAAVFEEDWERSSEIQAESAFAGAPRIADPNVPPPRGYVRMPLSDYLEG